MTHPQDCDAVLRLLTARKAAHGWVASRYPTAHPRPVLRYDLGPQVAAAARRAQVLTSRPRGRAELLCALGSVPERPYGNDAVELFVTKHLGGEGWQFVPVAFRATRCRRCVPAQRARLWSLLDDPVARCALSRTPLGAGSVGVLEAVERCETLSARLGELGDAGAADMFVSMSATWDGDIFELGEVVLSIAALGT